ncbi:hypothetical protein [Chryseolinea soli]|uniref:Uncharacterized protein n=1 Tax=Chryseolinea soli TaxID=2321403 RepID=A0A385SGU7_9BACT|nr:hypothetical protein [Chryseolinea soli]AYB30973.1 hypothetical protein D4L85_10450 [Chryseolinea soli]
MHQQDYLTMFATIAAILSAFYAYNSNRIAKKALELSRIDHQKREANFSVYLIDGYRWINREAEPRKFIFFHCTITNHSDSKGGYRSTLQIEYVKEDDSVSRVTLDHEPSHVKFLPQSLSSFPADIRIEERSTESKWLIFEEPAKIFGGRRIERFLINAIDTGGNVAFAECFLLKDFLHESK